MTDLKFTSPNGETTIKLEGTGRLGTVAPKTQLHIRKMTDKELIEIEIAYFQEQIKVKQKKLKELEQTKTPCEEAYNEWYGEYPTNTWQGDVNRWDAFQAGYNAAYEEKVSEWQPTPQTPEQVADGLKEAFREAVKQGVVSSTKPKTLTDLIYEWWDDVFTTHSNRGMQTSIEDLVDRIELWLPTEHDTNSYKWNQCIRMIREKLR